MHARPKKSKQAYASWNHEQTRSRTLDFILLFYAINEIIWHFAAFSSLDTSKTKACAEWRSHWTYPHVAITWHLCQENL